MTSLLSENRLRKHRNGFLNTIAAQLILKIDLKKWYHEENAHLSAVFDLPRMASPWNDIEFLTFFLAKTRA